MILYHGSNVEIDTIDLTKSKKGKDFGCGFYLSDNEEQAKSMGIFKAMTFGGECKVTSYYFDKDCMDNGDLQVCVFPDYSEDWARFVLNNRNNKTTVQIHDFDIVYGPIADDRVGAQIRRFENGDIDISEFIKRLKYMKGITFQYFFGTYKALEYLKKL